MAETAGKHEFLKRIEYNAATDDDANIAVPWKSVSDADNYRWNFLTFSRYWKDLERSLANK